MPVTTLLAAVRDAVDRGPWLFAWNSARESNRNGKVYGELRDHRGFDTCSFLYQFHRLPPVTGGCDCLLRVAVPLLQSYRLRVYLRVSGSRVLRKERQPKVLERRWRSVSATALRDPVTPRT